MRIGIDISVLNDKQKTGVGVYTYNLVKALLEQNRKDQFILFGISTFQTYDFLKNIEFKKYPNVELKIFKLPAQLFRKAFLLWQKLNWPKIENFIGPVDIFHSFNWYLPPQKKGKVVVTVFDMTAKLFPEIHQRKTVQLDNIRLQRIKKSADMVIAISESSKKDYLHFDPLKKVEVIYPGASDIFFKKIDRSKIKEVLTKYGLNSSYILSVGTLEPRKNIKRLINAYLQSNLTEKLVLVGSWGWEGAELAQIIKKNADKIICTGFVADEDLPFIYSQAVCFAYPSLYEGFGIPVLEAMTSGVAVITSKISSLPEVGGDAVYYVDPLDESDIKDALIKVVKNEKVREELIKKGATQARTFSWEASAKKLNLLYQQLIKSK